MKTTKTRFLTGKTCTLTTAVLAALATGADAHAARAARASQKVQASSSASPDGVSLFAPTRLYGTPDDVRRFVDAAHGLGIGVIHDVVYNHFGPDGCYLREFAAAYFSTAHQSEWGDSPNFDGPQSAAVREATDRVRLGVDARNDAGPNDAPILPTAGNPTASIPADPLRCPIPYSRSARRAAARAAPPPSTGR